MPRLSSLSHIGLARESNWGVAVAPTVWLPVSGPKPEDTVQWIKEQGFRAVPAKTFGAWQGPIHAVWQMDGLTYPDTIGLLLLATFGTDTVTGASAPYSHLFTLSSTTPPSLTIADYDAITERRYAGFLPNELDFSFTPNEGLKWSVKGESKKSVTATTTTPTFGTLPPFLGWQGTLNLGGSANVHMLSFDTAIKRSNQVLKGSSGTQDIDAIVPGPMEVTGKITVWMEDETELNYFLAGQPVAAVVTLTAANGHSITFTMTATVFEKGAVDRSKEYVTLDLNYEAVWNPTDAGPMAVTLVNSTASY